MANMPDISVEIALTSGYTTPDASRVWTDVSAKVEGSLSINRGRPDQFGQVQPSRLTITLDNTDGRFTPEYASGAYYPNIKKGRPIRVRARWVAGSGTWYTRFVGYIDEWPVQWPGGSSAFSTVTITASSRMARLGRSGEFKSIVEEEILYDSPVLYWPLGEPSGSTTAGNIAPGRTEVLTTTQVGTGGTLEFGAGIGPGTDSLSAPILTPVSAGNGKVLYTPLIQPLTATAATVIEVELDFITSVGTGVEVFRLRTSDPVAAPQLSCQIVSGVLYFAMVQGANITTVNSGAVTVADGLLHHMVGRISISGSTATASMMLDGAARVTASLTWTGITAIPNFTQVILGYAALTSGVGSTLFEGTLAHFAIYSGTTTLTDARIVEHYNANANGFTADASGARVARYARYAGIPTAEVSVETGLSTSIAHKDTTGQTPLSLMQDVATTEDGLVFDAGDGTLTFHARSHRYGSTAAFTLDTSAGDVEAGFEPKLDDQNLTNDMTASRPLGVTVRSVNAASYTEYGYYKESLEILTTSDNEVQSRADWQVNRFGTPRVVVPSVTADLVSCSSALVTSLLAADLGTRFTITNLPTQAPASTMDFFIEGVTEDISMTSYRISFNTSAAAYANVWVLDSSTLSQLDSTTVLAY